MQRKKITRIAVAAVPFALIVGLCAIGYCAEEGAHHVDKAAQMKDFMWRCVDFAVLAGILVYAIKKADMKGTLAARRSTIERQLKEAVAARELAEAKFNEYSDKLARANKDIEEMSANMKREGELEKERIIAEAQTTAARILEQAEAAANQEVQKARAELRAEAAKLAVELAEQKIKANIAKGDQDKLVGDYISKVVTLH
ncbi:ATP synthase F0 subunit B [Geomonas sp. RF6]|uniref:ATP synthase F0 subunit B n=1 Tax=Geomonas sp. RF6 TaxID=2897342 RepID=UPI001E3D9596|nr:ATP synthase F0 subunit B [Geomonas sp. RF6]UFS72289.1 ATP synthase F0 subunit B [Geomonas sp. RF6]